MTNHDALKAMTPEQMADFLTQERFNLLAPFIDKMGYFVHPQLVSINILKWLNSEVDNEQRAD